MVVVVPVFVVDVIVGYFWKYFFAFNWLPIFGDRFLYQTSGKFQTLVDLSVYLSAVTWFGIGQPNATAKHSKNEQIYACSSIDTKPGSCIWPQNFSMLIPHFRDISNLVRSLFNFKLFCTFVMCLCNTWTFVVVFHWNLIFLRTRGHFFWPGPPTLIIILVSS